MFDRKMFGALVGLVFFGLAGPANATLIGDSVQASLSTPSGTFNVTTQFTSPAIVGAGAEFTGSIEFTINTDLFSDIVVDVTASGFSVTGVRTSPWTGHGGGIDNLRIDLTDLDWLGIPGQIVGINDLGGAHGVTSIGFGPHSAFVGFGNFDFTFAGSVRNFSFDVVHVSEPGTLAIFAFGLAGLGFMGWRRRQADA